MHKYHFSKRSLGHLNDVNPELRELAIKVLNLGLFDFAITCGYRGKEEQEQLYFAGKTKVHFPNSKHNQTPAMAFDFVPFVDGKAAWNNLEAFYMAIGVFRGVAASMGLDIRSGGDWDGDFNPKDQSFHDLPHIELLN